MAGRWQVCHPSLDQDRVEGENQLPQVVLQSRQAPGMYPHTRINKRDNNF